MEAWSPLGHGGDVLLDEVLADIAGKYGKTVAQIILKWDIQRGIVTIPKSVHSERIDANIDVFDFQLSEDDMKKINALDSGRFIADLRDVELVKRLNELKVR